MDDLMVIAGVTKTYHLGETKVQALKGINLSIPYGEFAAIGGPSGSGKSTLLNICGLIDTADGGSYTLEGRKVSDLSAHELTRVRRERLGFIFQNFNLIPVMSARENVEYPLLLTGMEKNERKATVDEIIEKVGLSNYAHHLPDKLSGGQRQRVAIARALVKKPALVIADEPTANLDTVTANQVIDLMHALGSEHKTTFLIATHDERMVERCHRSLHLLDGEIVQ
jgi:putative ABC transport system ATP-binding protein